MSNSSLLFTRDGNELVVSDASSGAVLWHGQPIGAPVEDVHQLGPDAALVLCDYMAGPPGPFQNLICVDSLGRVVWRAELPTSSNTEAYVNIDTTMRISANSWSGHCVTLDRSSGKIIDDVFAK